MLMELYNQERITDRMLASTRREQKEETTLENIKNLMANLKLTAEQAMQALGIPAAGWSRYHAIKIY